MIRRWNQAENDYRGILNLERSRSSSVAVVIPAFERPEVLDRTLAGLVGQGDGVVDEVVVVDDGSSADLRTIVAAYDDVLPIEYVRQDVAGFGAGRARNLGASMTTSDVLLFLDSDCIPTRGLVESHKRWHDRVANAVVVGSRADIDASDWTSDDLSSSGVDPNDAGLAVDAWGEVPVSDWRSSFYRGNRRLIADDTAYRACVSNNLSLSRSAFEAVGGFSDAFTSWGGEDTEIGWRLFQDGNYLVPDDTAVVLHQVQGEDPVEGAERRALARDKNRSLMADLIPNRTYRNRPGSAYTVPQVTWVVWGATSDDIDGALRWIDCVGWLDNEIVVTGTDATVAPWRSRAAAADRFSAVPVKGAPLLSDILPQARGEFVAMVGAFAAADRSLMGRVMKRFAADTRLSFMQVPYIDAEATTVRRVEDLHNFDRVQGFPTFCVVRRRALAKNPRELTVVEAVEAVSTVERAGLISNPKVRVSADLVTGASRLGVRSVSRLGSRELARMAKAKLDRSPTAERAPDIDPEKPAISYIGFTGRSNLGDEAILQAVRELLPTFTIEREHPDPVALMVGGGTIINGKNYYLTRLMREDRPGIAKFVFAPGVRDPEYWGITEPVEDWWSFFRSAEPVTVRGPNSASHLTSLGWNGEAVVIGDPALSLSRPDVSSRTDTVIVAPLHTGGNLHGGDDETVLASLADEVKRLAAQGLEVTLMASFPEDDRWILEMERRLGSVSVSYLAGYADLDVVLAEITRARLVIGERMHASILAAAMHTPFVALEYRPKVLDFALSIDSARHVVRTDDMSSLRSAVDTALRDGPAISRHLAEQVARLTALQRQHAAMIVSRLGEATSL